MVLNFTFFFLELAHCAISNDFTRDICLVFCHALNFAVRFLGSNPFFVRNLWHAALWGPPVPCPISAESCKWAEPSFDQVYLNWRDPQISFLYSQWNFQYIVFTNLLMLLSSWMLCQFSALYCTRDVVFHFSAVSVCGVRSFNCFVLFLFCLSGFFYFFHSTSATTKKGIQTRLLFPFSRRFIF